MYRNWQTQKQKLFLQKPHRLVRSSSSSSPSPLRRLARPRNLIIGLTATVGISSLAFAASQQGLHLKSNQINKASTSSSTPVNTQQTTNVDAKIQNAASAGAGEATGANPTQGQAGSTSNAQVTINNETIPINDGGTVQRTFTDKNGSTYSVDITVDSSSSSSSSDSTSTSIDINGTNSTLNDTRGSPRR